MATRTFQLFGKAYSTTGQVSLTVTWNGSQVFSGTVTTINSAPPGVSLDLEQLATWDGTTDLTGNVPLTIAVTGGSLYFGLIKGNYCGWEPTPDAFFDDLNNNTESSDGKDNVTIDGVAQPRTVTKAEDVGDWHYLIADGSTFACDYVVDPAKIVGLA